MTSQDMRLGSSLTTFPGFGEASSLPCTIYEHHNSIRSTAALLVCVEHLVLSSELMTKELALPACVYSRHTTIFRRIVTNQHEISTSNIPNNFSQSQRAQEEHSCTLLGPRVLHQHSPSRAIFHTQVRSFVITTYHIHYHPSSHRTPSASWLRCSYIQTHPLPRLSAAGMQYMVDLRLLPLQLYTRHHLRCHPFHVWKHRR